MNENQRKSEESIQLNWRIDKADCCKFYNMTNVTIVEKISTKKNC